MPLFMVPLEILRMTAKWTPIDKIIRRERDVEGGFIYLVKFSNSDDHEYMRWNELSPAAQEEYIQYYPDRASDEDKSQSNGNSGKKPGKPRHRARRTGLSQKYVHKLRNLKTEKQKAKRRTDTSTSAATTTHYEPQAVEDLVKGLDDSYDSFQIANETRIASFPSIPSISDCVSAVNNYATAMTTPALSRAVCSSCAQLQWLSDIRVYSLRNHKRNQKELNAPKLPKEILAAMQLRLINNTGIAVPNIIASTYAELKDLAMNIKGIDFDSHTINICLRCYGYFTKSRLPPCAMANNFLFGDVPDVLKGLTWVEQRLVAMYRVSSHIVNLRGRDRIDARTRTTILKLKGHIVCLPQDTPHLQRLLPPPVAEINAMIQGGNIEFIFNLG